MSCMPHRWYYVYTKITPMPITVYHSNYRKQIFFSLFCNELSTEKPYIHVFISIIWIHTRYKHIDMAYKYIDTCLKWLWLFQLWCSSSFWTISACEFWSGREGSPKNSLISDSMKLFWERRCSEEEATQLKCNNGWIRGESLSHTGVQIVFKLKKRKEPSEN